MIGPGTVINPIVKVITTVIILGAVGIFIVKPALDTTKEAIDSVNQGVRSAEQESRRASDDFDLNFARDRATSFAASLQRDWPAAAREIKGCMKAAGDNLAAMRTCETRGEKLVHTVQSDRGFALSYADSLDSQGAGADADRVRACVKEAGFKPAAMQRCRDLADHLLFG